MSHVVILRRQYHRDYTIGHLWCAKKFALRTLELPWLNNRRNVSCYPPGIYDVNYLERSASGKYKKVWHVQNVKNRSGILFHAGNLLDQTNGCTLVGKKIGSLNGEVAVLSSKTGLNLMRKHLEGKNFKLIVF